MINSYDFHIIHFFELISFNDNIFKLILKLNNILDLALNCRNFYFILNIKLIKFVKLLIYEE